VLNPERGYVSSANQFPVNDAYPYYIYDYNYEDYRNRRINQRLDKLNNITFADMKDLQNDTYNMQASDALPFLLDTLNIGAISADQKEVYDILRGWNYYNNVNSKAPTLYQIWWQQFHKMLWDEFDDTSFVLRKPQNDVTIHLLKTVPDLTYIDSKSTTAVESLEELVMDSFVEAVSLYQRWEEENSQEALWGVYKNTSMRHMLRLNPFSVTNLQVGGGRNIVAANSSTAGQSWKMIVELGEKPNIKAVYPGGQSGNPGSPYYDNMVETWASGNYYDMLFMNSTEDKPGRIMLKQTLHPAEKED